VQAKLARAEYRGTDDGDTTNDNDGSEGESEQQVAASKYSKG
jgi:hypothetical protein